MLFIETKLESTTIKNHLNNTCKVWFVLQISEKILSFGSIYFFTFSSTYIIKCGDFNVLSLMNTFSLLLSFSFGVFQLF